MHCELNILNNADGDPINRTPIVVRNAYVESDGDFVRLVGSENWEHDALLEHQRCLYLPHYRLHAGGVEITGLGCNATRRVEWQLYPPGTFEYYHQYPYGTPPQEPRALAELAAEAIAVQDACNPLGLSKSYAEALQELADRLKADGLPSDTQAISTHPINQLWASKLHDVARMGLSDKDQYHNAYAACKTLAAE